MNATTYTLRGRFVVRLDVVLDGRLTDIPCDADGKPDAAWVSDRMAEAVRWRVEDCFVSNPLPCIWDDYATVTEVAIVNLDTAATDCYSDRD